MGTIYTSKDLIANRVDCKAGDMINGKYRIDKLLGEGSFGCVYKVVDISGQVWALKLLRLWDVPSDIRQPLVDRFEMEFKTGCIPSEHLVHSADSGYLNGNPYIVMEFCSGGDLSGKIGSPLSSLTTYAQHILFGLWDLHKNGKVHRDLKPENVLLKSNGVAVLTDFGISGDRNKRMTERNIFGKPYQIFGTYAYMPPEQVNRARGNTTVLPTTDICSFGVLMYQLITGSLPFGRLEDQNDLVLYQRRGKAGDWDRMTLYNAANGRLWEPMIDGCLKPDYKQRLQSVDQVLKLIPNSEGTGRYQPARPQSVVTAHTPAVSSGSKLRIMQGEEYGKVYDLKLITTQTNRKMITVGRDPSNTIQLKEYSTAYTSRRHFTLECHNDKWIIRDGQWSMEEKMWLTSSNGTYVNSSEVSQNGMVLNNGDIISAGEIKIKYEA